MLNLTTGQTATLTVTGLDAAGNTVNLIPGEDVFAFALSVDGVVTVSNDGYPSSDPVSQLTAQVQAVAEGNVEITVTDNIASSGAAVVATDTIAVAAADAAPAEEPLPAAPAASQVATVALTWTVN